MSTDLHTLSGAYALNALSPDEAEQFKRHLETCDACRQEVAELREAAAKMGASEALAPPQHLRTRVLTAADRTAQLPPLVTTLEQGRKKRAARFLGAVAAALVIAVGAIGVSQLQEDEPQSLLATEVVQVFEAPDANTATMETANGGRISVATSPSLNKMAVDTDELPPLEEGQVYQLWAIHDGEVASAGLLEQPDAGAAMDMPAPETEVAITIEPAGGSELPTSEPIMRVTPSEV